MTARKAVCLVWLAIAAACAGESGGGTPSVDDLVRGLGDPSLAVREESEGRAKKLLFGLEEKALRQTILSLRATAQRTEDEEQRQRLFRILADYGGGIPLWDAQCDTSGRWVAFSPDAIAVAIASGDRGLACHDVKKNAVLWKVAPDRLPGWIDKAWIVGDAVWASGWTLRGQGWIAGYRASDGEPLPASTRILPGLVSGSAAARDYLILGGETGKAKTGWIHACETGPGRRAWDIGPGELPGAVAALACDGAHLFAGGTDPKGDGWLSCYKLEDRSLRWSVQGKAVPGDARRMLAGRDKLAVLGMKGETEVLAVFDKGTGKVELDKDLGPHEFPSQQAVIAGNRILIARGDPRNYTFSNELTTSQESTWLHCLDLGTGKLLWEKQGHRDLPGWIRALQVDDRRVWIGGQEIVETGGNGVPFGFLAQGWVQCLDLETGKLRWEVEPGRLPLADIDVMRVFEKEDVLWIAGRITPSKTWLGRLRATGIGD